MGVVLTESSFRFMIFVDDHEPAHVHVYVGKTLQVALFLDDALTQKGTQYAKKGDLKKIRRIARDNLAFLRSEWTRIHQPPDEEGQTT
jgi:hypothetical protein